MKVSFITTFNKFIYESYGNDLVDAGTSLSKSWEKYSNGNILNVFSEEDFHISEKNIILHKLSEDTGIYEFINNNKNKPHQLTTSEFYNDFISAEYSPNNPERLDANKNHEVYFEHEKKGALKYCFKPFSWLQSLSLGADRTVFIDADFIIRNPIDSNNIYNLLEDEYCCGLFERIFKNIDDNKGLVLDPCFLIFNNRHEQIRDFISDIVSLYTTEKIFTFPYWHDTYAFYHVLSKYKKQSVKFKNLSPTFFHNRRGPLHPSSDWPDIEKGSELSQIRDIFGHYGGMSKLNQASKNKKKKEDEKESAKRLEEIKSEEEAEVLRKTEEEEEFARQKKEYEAFRISNLHRNKVLMEDMTRIR